MAELLITPRRPIEECIDLLQKIESVATIFSDLHVSEVHMTQDSKLIKIIGTEAKLKTLQNSLLNEGIPGGKIITDKELRERAKNTNNKKEKP